MKIGLIGYGKMGKAIERLAIEQGHGIVTRITSMSQDFSQLQATDVCFDFTAPNVVLDHIEKVVFLEKPLVVGTTGWEKEMPLARLLAKKSQRAVLAAPNFSIGVYLFRMILREAVRSLEYFEYYKACGMEVHHEEKKDSPSGTAKQLAHGLRDLSFSSLRSGYHPGTHQILFDSPEDTIELIHRARNREGFARGALEAGEWIMGKQGFFTFDDFMKEKMTCKFKV